MYTLSNGQTAIFTIARIKVAVLRAIVCGAYSNEHHPHPLSTPDPAFILQAGLCSCRLPQQVMLLLLSTYIPLNHQNQNVSSVPRALYTEGKNHPATLVFFFSLRGDSSKETALTDCLCWITVTTYDVLSD